MNQFIEYKFNSIIIPSQCALKACAREMEYKILAYHCINASLESIDMFIKFRDCCGGPGGVPGTQGGTLGEGGGVLPGGRGARGGRRGRGAKGGRGRRGAKGGRGRRGARGGGMGEKRVWGDRRVK